MRILRNKKKALKLIKKHKIHKTELSILLGIIFISFILPSSVALYNNNQSVQVSNNDEFLEMLQKSQSASLSQQWSQGTTVSGCINPWDFWEFLWWLFNHLKPDMDFTANVTDIIPGETVQFEYTGGDIWWPKTYHWNFGDGGLSEERNPTHTFNTPGIYDISLTIIYFWIFDDTLMKEDYIEVSQTNNVPEADFEVNNVSPLTGDLLQFTYTGTEGDGIDSYSWDFGDGIGFSDERNPEYSYSSAGVYDVSLLVIDYDGDEDTVIKEEYITVTEDFLPLADFEADIVEFLEGGIVQFTYTGSEGNGIESYSWDFGDGGVSSEENPSYQYLIPGLFTVSLTVVDTDGDEDTAVKDEFITVIEDLEPIADFTANAHQVIQNGFLNFTYTGSEGNGIEIYSWNFGDGSELATEQNPTHQFLEAGVFTVSLTVVDTDGDESTETKVDYITVDDDLLPIADFTSDLQTVIGDDIIQFTFTGENGNSPTEFLWDFGDGGTSEEQDPYYQYYDPGFYTITLTVKDSDEDEHTEIKFDYIEVLEDLLPRSDFIVDTTEAYTGELIQFSFMGEEGNEPSEFFYEFGDGSTSIEQNPTHSYSEAGIYSVILTVTDIDGDIDALEFVDYISIDENILPIADFSADSTDVFVDELLQFLFNGTYGNDPNEFYWDFGDGTTSSEENPSHQYNEPGNYNVSLTITDIDGDIDTLEIIDYIKVEKEQIEIPMVIYMGGAVGAIAVISTGVILSKRRK